MSPDFRRLGGLLLALSVACVGRQAQAQPPAVASSMPALTLIVGFAAGGSADSIARVVGVSLGKRLGRAVIIENRAGAGGNLAAKAAIAAAPDGNTLLVTTAALAINNTLYRNKGFDIAELRTISIVADSPETFAVNKTGPARTLIEFIAQTKGRQISYATAGVGSSSHIFAQSFFKFVVKADAAHVPFRSGAEAANAALGGHVDLVAASLSGAPAQIKSGEIRAIAIATTQRLADLPDVPTYSESGFPGLVSSSWVGFFAPAATPEPEVIRLNAELVTVIAEKDVNERLIALGFVPRADTLGGSVAFFRSELSTWGQRVRSLSVALE